MKSQRDTGRLFLQFNNLDTFRFLSRIHPANLATGNLTHHGLACQHACYIRGETIHFDLDPRPIL